AVGDGLQAGLLLQADRIDDAALENLAIDGLGEFATNALAECVLQLARTEQTAYVLGSKRRIEFQPGLFGTICDYHQARAARGSPRASTAYYYCRQRAGIVKVNAAIANKPGEPLEVASVDLEGPRAGEALIEIKATGICHTDAYTLSGADPEGLFPAILGHEGAGIVVETGP